MKILFLSPRQCWPPRSGAKLREYYFARALGEAGDLTYLYFADPGAEPLTRTDLPFCREIAAIPKPGAYTFVQMVQGIAGRWPLPVLNYTSAAMDVATVRAVSKTRYDIIHADSIHMVRYARAAQLAGGGRVIYNWHNIESEAMSRFAQTVESAPKRWYAQHTAAKLEALEREILPQALGHVVCSEREHQKLSAWCPPAAIHIAENGVDTSAFPGALNPNPEPRLIFVGSMDYFPNIDAAVHFSTAIWPQLRTHLPRLTLTIVGARPTPQVLELASLEGVTVTGTVPDVRPFYANALAAIVPLRTGGGTRLKILEAMAAGTPVISTELGAEGLAVTPDENILLASAESPEPWLQSVRTLLTQPECRAQLAASARHLVESRYDWRSIGNSLATEYAAWMKKPPGPAR